MADVANSKLFSAIEGIQQIKDALVVLVKTEWNAEVANELEAGCIKVLDEYGIRHKTIVVPGAIEIPFAIQQCRSVTNLPSAFIALGCVVRGDTPHFDYVCQAVTSGITQLNLSMQVPVIFGVLTVNTQQQALDRIGGEHGHKGEEAAITALKMIALKQGLEQEYGENA
jgi:6,7-dimethyl-8-ribityllumazine synthase